jgi:predicted membrane protein
MTTRTTLPTSLFHIALGMIFVPMLLGVAPAQAKSPNGRFVTFDIPGGANVFPNFITPAGVVTGNYDILVNNNFVTYGFLRRADGTVITISVPGSASTSVGAGEGEPFAGPPINPSGAITGSYSDASGLSHGFVRAPDGTFTTFDAPGAVNGTLLCCITSEGTIAGTSFDANFFVHGFLRAPNDTFTMFDPPGSTLTVPTSTNPAGAITGWYVDASGAMHGFLRARDGTIATFDAPGAVNGTQPNGINPAGAITGVAYASGVDHGFVRDRDGTITTFDVPGSAPLFGAFPVAINPAEAITGFYGDGEGFFHGFLRERGGTFTTVDPPGSGYTGPAGINPAGVIVGNFQYLGVFTLHGFIFFPH